jgi:uncharacterized protein
VRTPAIASLRPFAAALVLAAFLPLPAPARDFVQDQAGMFSASTVAQLNQRISNFNAQTGKEIVVVTVPSLNGATLQSAASSAFSSNDVNGVLIFIAKSDRRDIIVPDRAGVQAGWFTPDVTRGIRESMEAQFRSENFDAGVTAAVDGVLNVYRAHVGSLRTGSSNANYSRAPASAYGGSGGFHLSMFWWIIIAVVGFLVLRSILRSMSGPRYYGGAPGPGAPGPMPGYGGGYGYGGGGGSFWSGLLGGLGGAWLGNEIFGQHAGGGMIGPADASQASGGGWGGNDGGGWQSDAGQADVSGGSAGDWSGGGFGGDSGGGFGGGDFGGGGGDSGGGW